MFSGNTYDTISNYIEPKTPPKELKGHYSSVDFLKTIIIRMKAADSEEGKRYHDSLFASLDILANIDDELTNLIIDNAVYDLVVNNLQICITAKSKSHHHMGGYIPQLLFIRLIADSPFILDIDIVVAGTTLFHELTHTLSHTVFWLKDYYIRLLEDPIGPLFNPTDIDNIKYKKKCFQSMTFSPDDDTAPKKLYEAFKTDAKKNSLAIETSNPGSIMNPRYIPENARCSVEGLLGVLDRKNYKEFPVEYLAYYIDIRTGILLHAAINGIPKEEALDHLKTLFPGAAEYTQQNFLPYLKHRLSQRSTFETAREAYYPDITFSGTFETEKEVTIQDSRAASTVSSFSGSRYSSFASSASAASASSSNASQSNSSVSSSASTVGPVVKLV